MQHTRETVSAPDKKKHEIKTEDEIFEKAIEEEDEELDDFGKKKMSKFMELCRYYLGTILNNI